MGENVVFFVEKIWNFLQNRKQKLSIQSFLRNLDICSIALEIGNCSKFVHFVLCSYDER